MATLLLEIGCEELPAWACIEASAQLPVLCERELGLQPSGVFVGPRRLAILVHDLPEREADELRRGPAERVAFDEAGRPTKAAEGFARSSGVGAGALERRDGYVWAHISGRSLAETLSGRLAALVRGLNFRRSMRWSAQGLRFPRPVRWIVAKLDSETLEVRLPDVPSGGTSFGHRFRSGEVEIANPDAYAETLRAAGVEPDAVERGRLIVEGLDAGGEWSDPAGVIAEVVHLVESPIVLEGRFDERYLELPRRVVETAMQSHQRYFPRGADRFAFVSNGGDPDVVRAGNERVLETRLGDAAFTFERDVARGIHALASELRSITFFEGAGTFADKTERLVQLVERLGGGEASLEAARLAKADQAAELVREFPELEGHVGAEYARLAGYPEAVCTAVDEHYLPDAGGGPLPSTEAGKVVSAADKIDNLQVSFRLGHRPTGSRDPYGLRRAAIGVCRLATEGGLTIPRDLLEADVADFVEERFEGLLDVPVELIRAARRSAVAEVGGVASLARALAGLEDGHLDRLHTAYTRSDRLAGRAEDAAASELRAELLTEAAERGVATALSNAEPRIAAALRELDLETAFAAADELSPPLDRFFEDVLVMAEDRAVRANRLRLLLDVRDTVGLLGDFSEIPR